MPRRTTASMIRGKHARPPKDRPDPDSKIGRLYDLLQPGVPVHTTEVQAAGPYFYAHWRRVLEDEYMLEITKIKDPNYKGSGHMHYYVRTGEWQGDHFIQHLSPEAAKLKVHAMCTRK